MRSPVYYAILIALLIALVVILVLLIRKRKREDELIRAYQEKMDRLRAERKAEEEKKKTHYSTYNEKEQKVTKWRNGRQYIDDDRHIPKYAAGDDMDRLQRPEPDIKGDLIYIAALMAVISCIAVVYLNM